MRFVFQIDAEINVLSSIVVLVNLPTIALKITFVTQTAFVYDPLDVLDQISVIRE